MDTTPAPAGTTRGAATPLMGRDEELGRLEALLEGALQGKRTVVLVVGEAGMGKSRLVGELVERARARGVSYASGRCWEATDAPPYWAWTQVLRSLGGELPAFDDRFELFQGVEAFLSSLSTPVLIVLEDLHAADQPSLLLLRFLAAHASDVPLMIIGTCDEVEMRARPEHGDLLSSFERDVVRIDLSPLGPTEVKDLYAHISGDTASEPIARAIYEMSEGNPFFVEETVKLLVSKGDIHRPDLSTGFRVPKGVRGIVRARLASLPDGSVEILGVASVLGREFDTSVLASVAELDHDSVLDLLEAPLATEIVEEASVLGRYRFTHILLRETLYEDLTAARRMRLHRRAGEVLEASPSDDETRLPELAHHWFKAAQASDFTKTVEYVSLAARHAADRGAFEESARLYQRALKAAHSAGADKATIDDIRAGFASAKERAAEGAGRGDALPAEDAIFAREGDVWLISYEGASARVRDSRGLHYIARLLANPGVEIHAVDLVQGGGDAAPTEAAREDRRAGVDPFGDLGPVVDANARAAYKQRIEELREDIEDADALNDPERAARARAELDTLTDHLAVALGVGGRTRSSTGPAERARVNVTRTIKASLNRIEELHPALGAHLRATIKTGFYCTYTPDPRVGIKWTT